MARVSVPTSSPRDEAAAVRRAEPAASADRRDRTARPDCAHCGLPVIGRADRFCCDGCRTVHGILTAEGLGRFYELGGGTGQPVGAEPRATDLDWLPGAEAAGHLADGVTRVVCDLQGIHCTACVWLLQELWRRQPGALRIDLNPALGRAELVYDPRAGTLSQYAARVAALGYRLGPPGKSDTSPQRGLLIRLGVCIALALNAMMFAFAEYLGLAEADGANLTLFRGLSFALSTAAVVVGGPTFFRAAIAGLRQGVLHLDLPISIGIALAWSASALAWISGAGDTYFDTVTVFVALMLVGRYLQAQAVQRNRDYLLANDGAEHLHARRLRDGRLERVSVRRLEVGDELLLAPGDLLPLDAVVLDSCSALPNARGCR